MNTTALPEKLYRNVEERWARRFVDEGEVLFRPLTYFANAQDERSDTQEGKVDADASGLTLEVWDDNSNSYKHKIEMKSGIFARSLSRPDCCFVSCYSLLPQPKFGSATIEITDPKEFISRVERSLKAALDINLLYGRIDYYDETDRPNQSADAKHLWKFKRLSYESEKEFRLVFFLDADELMSRAIFEDLGSCELPTRTNTGSLRFGFGSLSDVAKVI